MATFNVWWTTGKFDGDATFDNLADAEARFDEVKGRRDIVEASITDGDENTIRWYNAADRDQN